ncbi:MAG: hypothetical protein ACYDAR_01125 [Thermomicrobiales bacterium]
MAMYLLTIIGEWNTGRGNLSVARAACEFAAENSVEAMDAARALLAALLGNDEDRAECAEPVLLRDVSDGSATALVGVLAVEVRYLESHDRTPVDLHWIVD